MTDVIQLEIQRVLDAESTAYGLSAKLFGPNGLFAQAGETESQRRLIANSPLFKSAQKRLRDLQYQEASEFSKSVQGFVATKGETVVKLEHHSV